MSNERKELVGYMVIWLISLRKKREENTKDKSIEYRELITLSVKWGLQGASYEFRVYKEKSRGVLPYAPWL